MKRITYILSIIILLTGCTSEFDRELEKGKSSMKLEKYEEASTHLENALIEEPTNKDAKILLDKATEKLDDIKLKNVFIKYSDESRDVVLKFIETKKPKSAEEKKKDGSKEYKIMYDNLLIIKKDSDDIGMHYQNNTVISDMHKIFQNSVDDSITEYGNLFAMTTMIEDEKTYDDEKFKAFGKFVSKYSKSSNELMFKYVNTTKDFKISHGLLSEEK